MNTEAKAKILSRVKKLITLANDAGATEGERDNALRMAHKTLAAYNLSMAEVEAAGGKIDEPRVDAEHEQDSPPWQRTIYVAVARLYFCDYFYSRARRAVGSRVTHHIIGRESNTITTREIALFVVRAVKREAARKAREGFLDGTWERDFCKGAAHSVYLRCEALRTEAERDQRQQPAGTPGTAIVLASLYATEAAANRALILAQNGKLGTGRGGRGAATSGYGHGREYGKTVSLNRQVGNASSNNPRLK